MLATLAIINMAVAAVLITDEVVNKDVNETAAIVTTVETPAEPVLTVE